MDSRALAITLVLLLAAPSLTTLLVPAVSAADVEDPGDGADSEPALTSNVTVLSVEHPRELDPFDYSDVLVLVNNNSAMSRQVGEYFADARGIPDEHVAYLDVPAREVINKDQYEDLEDQVKTFMLRNNLISSINYIVTTKGFPLKIHNDSLWFRACVDEELALIYGPSEGSIGNLQWVYSPYYGDREYFNRSSQGMYIVNRLTGYDWDDVKALIDHVNGSYGNRGKFVLDVDPGRDSGGYVMGNNWLRSARVVLEDRGEDVFYDETRWYVNYQEDVMGYASWGSNDYNDTDNAKPHNTWVNGSIAETFVSTGGRTFTYPPSYGQSMVADIIAEGVTGVKGYVDEPFLTAIAHPDILFERYTAGFNLGESYRMASQYLGWMGVVVGDPLCSPYRDIPDLATDDDWLVPGNATPATGDTVTFDVQVRNHGGRVEDANITLYVDGQPWVSDNLTFDGFSVTTLRIAIRAPLESREHQVKVALNDPLGFFETLYDNNEAITHITPQERPVIEMFVSDLSPMTLDSVRFEVVVASAPRPVSLFYFDFGDGSERMVLQTNATYHPFSDDGEYQVGAWVLDEANVLSLRVDVTVTVMNRPPLPIIKLDTDTRLTGESFSFNASSSSDMDGTVVSAGWDFGDENTTDGWEVHHSYRWPGEYVVRMTVTDDDGDSASVTRRVSVLNRPPVASLAWDEGRVWKGRTTTLNATASNDVDGRIRQYEWDFGDGSEGQVTTSPLVNHVFEAAGQVTVTLSIVDDLGAGNSTQVVVTVLNRAPTVDLRVRPTTVLTGEDVEMDASASYDEDGSLTGYDFLVLDGDGQVVHRFLGTTPEATWRPTDDGEYLVAVLVTDDDGAVTDSRDALSTSPKVTVVNRRPLVLLDEATAQLDGTVVDAPSTLVAGVEATDLDGEVASVEWLDGVDGSKLAEGPSVTIPLVAERRLDIRVVVTDDDGAQASAWLNVTVNEAPEAAFNVTVDGVSVVTAQVHPGRMLTFDGGNSYDPGGIARYQWDFGDGFTQEGMTISHAYDGIGEYTITLKVTDDNGASDIVTYTVTVVEEPSPDTSGLAGSTLALLIGLVVAVVIIAFLFLLKRSRDGDIDGGLGD